MPEGDSLFRLHVILFRDLSLSAGSLSGTEVDYMKIATQLLVSPRRNASARCDHQVHVQGTLHYSRCPLLTEPCYSARG